ncbi:MAG: Rieske (2Fe-2S) protein [Candidatus Binataceae bacterium]
MGTFIKVARRGDVAEGSGKVIEARGRTIALFNADGSFYAIDNACKHRGGPLGDGEVRGTRVICPWHGWEYDFAAGRSIDDAGVRLACFAVRVEGEDVLVEL